MPNIHYRKDQGDAEEMQKFAEVDSFVAKIKKEHKFHSVQYSSNNCGDRAWLHPRQIVSWMISECYDHIAEQATPQDLPVGPGQAPVARRCTIL